MTDVAPGKHVVLTGVDRIAEINRLRVSVGWDAWSSSETRILGAYEVGLGVFDDDALIGWCGALRIDRKEAMIVDVMVAPTRRRRNIGALLVFETIEILRERRFRGIRVHASPGLASWYEGLGFRRDGNSGGSHDVVLWAVKS